MVWVTVLDARAAAPVRRLASLVEVARSSAASDVMAFTLAGWAVSTPAASIWFCDGAVPETRHIGEAKSSPVLRPMPAHPPLSANGVRSTSGMRTPCATSSPTGEADEVRVVH